MTAKIAAATPEDSSGPTSEPQDGWLDEGGHRHRIVFDTISAKGLGIGMNFATNFFLANQQGYGISAGELSVVVVMRHASTAFAFNDAMWDKYGDYFVSHTEVFDPHTQARPRINLYRVQSNGAPLPNGKATLVELAQLGARFAVCAMAAANLAKSIAEDTQGKDDSVLNELKANLIPHSVMTPAGIVAVNRAQEHGYTFSYCG
ncbi:hypothetical protein VSR68_34950 [Paraburkholderia phymatum]|uniref:hypothetical protein n=1 Tax=Paraburkholderia phymatum TaxID=148447 RepID=UPI00316EB29E